VQVGAAPIRWPSCRPTITWANRSTWADGAAGGASCGLLSGLVCSEGAAATSAGLGRRRGYTHRSSPKIRRGLWPANKPFIPIPFPLSLAPGACRLLQLVKPAYAGGGVQPIRGLEVLGASPNGFTSAWRLRSLVGGPSSTGVRSAIGGGGPWRPCRWPLRRLARRRKREQDRACQRCRSAQGGAHRSRWLVLAARAEAPELRAQQAPRWDGRCWAVWSAELGWPLPSSTAPRLALAGGLGLGWPWCLSWGQLGMLLRPTSTAGCANQV